MVWGDGWLVDAMVCYGVCMFCVYCLLRNFSIYKHKKHIIIFFTLLKKYFKYYTTLYTLYYNNRVV